MGKIANLQRGTAKNEQSRDLETAAHVSVGLKQP